MKTSIFDMNFVLPPVVEIHEVVKDMPMTTDWRIWFGTCQENSMKTSIFDMNFVLPPMVEMIEVEKEMPTFLSLFSCARHSCSAYNCQENT